MTYVTLAKLEPMNKNKGIVWFRNDLRLHDNEALLEALDVCDQILPIYIFDDRVFDGKTSFGFPKISKLRRQFISQSVQALRSRLESEFDSTLIVRSGTTEDILFELAHRHKTRWIFCNRERTSEEVAIQDAVEKGLWSIGQELRYTRGKMLLYTADLPFPITHVPEQFSTFKKEVSYIPIRKPLSIPKEINTNLTDIDRGEIPFLKNHAHDQLLPEGGEEAGLRQLNLLLGKLKSGGTIGSIEMSPWISHGCLSPKKFYHELIKINSRKYESEISSIILKLLRRDHFRFMAKKYGNLIFIRSGIQNEKTSTRRDEKIINQWCAGKTGVPIIDAAMRSLVATGLLSYQLRVLVGTYFIDVLDQDWIVGAEYLESHLIDYDPCSNYGNWNRLAGVGAVKSDHGIFNLENQTKLLDPNGEFVERWLHVT